MKSTILLLKSGEMFIVVPFLVLALIIAVPLVIAMLRQSRRRRELKQLSGRMGFSFVPTANFSDYFRGGECDLFAKGYRLTNKVKNVLQGEIKDVHVLVFDYSYKESLGSNVQKSFSQTTRATVACFSKPPGPPFILYKKGLSYLAPKRFSLFLDEGLKAYEQNGNNR